MSEKKKKYRVEGQIIIAVHTIVEADDEEEALDAATCRRIHQPHEIGRESDTRWVMSNGCSWNDGWTGRMDVEELKD